MRIATRRIFSILFSLLMIAFGCSKNEKQSSQEFSTIKSLSTSIKNCIEKLEIDTISDFLADDVTLYNVSTLEYRDGRSSVTGYFSENLNELKDKELLIISKGVRVVSADHAIEQGVIKIFNKGIPSQKLAWKADYGKKEGIWKLYKLTLLSLHKPFSNFDKLQSLAWFVGMWKCQEEDAMKMASQVCWDKNKNFLIQRFSLSILDQHELSGSQIIGWDPSNKQIFSWTYDSKGGFGSGKWVKQDDVWYVYVDYTLNDGRKASVTHVYKKIDTTTYTFSSENREIGGVLFPNCGPFTVVRRG